MRIVTPLILALLLLIWPQSALSQDTSGGAVHGLVDDDATNAPLAATTVALHSAQDSSLVTGTMTLADGSFMLDGLANGRYYLRISFVGYHPQIIPDVAITTSQRRVDAGTIRLQPDTAELDEVQVSAEREFMEVGIDRTVYNTREQPITAGGSGREILETIPSVEVDIDGNISLRGSQGVTVHLNGKPAPMTGEALTSFLEGLSGEAIERVEVIPNPSARYEPDGTGGILNIVLAKGVDIGWGGSVNGHVNTRGLFGGSAAVHAAKARGVPMPTMACATASGTATAGATARTASSTRSPS